MSSPILSAVSGVCSAGLRIDTFPHANAGAIFNAAIMMGPFQGTIWSADSDRLAQCVVEHRRIGRIRLTLNLRGPSGVVPEDFYRTGGHAGRVRNGHAIVESLERRQFIRMLLDYIGDGQEIARALMRADLGPLAVIVCFPHDFDGFIHVCLSPSATRASTSLFAGLTVSKVLPDLAETYLPLIRSCFGFFRKSRTAVEVTPFADRSVEGAAVAIFNFLSALYAFFESNSRASRGGNTTATALTPGS
jgi:hypothetical protein